MSTSNPLLALFDSLSAYTVTPHGDSVDFRKHTFVKSLVKMFEHANLCKPGASKASVIRRFIIPATVATRITQFTSVYIIQSFKQPCSVAHIAHFCTMQQGCYCSNTPQTLANEFRSNFLNIQPWWKNSFISLILIQICEVLQRNVKRWYAV